MSLYKNSIFKHILRLRNIFNLYHEFILYQKVNEFRSTCIGCYLKKIFLMILQIFSDCCQKLSQFGPLYPSPQNSFFPMPKIVSLDWSQNHRNECRRDTAVVVLNEIIKSHLNTLYLRFVYFIFSKFSIEHLTILKNNHLPSYVTGQRSSNCSW